MEPQRQQPPARKNSSSSLAPANSVCPHPFTWFQKKEEGERDLEDLEVLLVPNVSCIKDLEASLVPNISDHRVIQNVSGRPSQIGSLRVGWLSGHTRGTSLAGVPREQKMLKRLLPRVMYHQVY